MGWLRLVGSLKLQVSFAEYRLFWRALLQKKPIILRHNITIEAINCNIPGWRRSYVCQRPTWVRTGSIHAWCIYNIYWFVYQREMTALVYGSTTHSGSYLIYVWIIFSHDVCWLIYQHEISWLCSDVVPLNYSSPLQKSPTKKTIFCKRNL